MKKIGKKIKENFKLFLGIVIGVSMGCGSVIAARVITSQEVFYTHETSHVANVQEAIEELYQKSKFSFHLPNLQEDGLRYTGKDPDNYVKFNEELWRILGIFNGEMKIIKSTSLGPLAWDREGKNTWGNNSLYNYLNTTYYNSLNETSKNMVKKATWNIGGWNTASIPSHLMYEYEENKDGADSSVSGFIGLMSVSDYGYASSNCYSEIILSDYNSSTCRDTNWLYAKEYEWTITHYSPYLGYAFNINIDGSVYESNHAPNEYAVRPSLFLKSKVYIKGGAGTKENPYILYMES